MIQKPRLGLAVVAFFVCQLYFLAVVPVISMAQFNRFDTNENGYFDDEELPAIVNYWAQHKPVGYGSTISHGTMTVMLPGDVPLELVKIPAGWFIMGSPDTERDRDNDEGPGHIVTISRDFYLGQFEVTQAQWKAVMGSNNPSNWKGDDLPVEMVSWNNCQEFIAKLNELNLGTFRLPTEAEWEYACRAGTVTRFYWGDDPGDKEIGKYAWYYYNSGSQTHGVGQKIPNPWGLYDMSGNVWEWCQDGDGNYPSESQTDYTGAVRGSRRVLRGGSWHNLTRHCRSAFRSGGDAVFRSNFLGFRVAFSRTQ